MRLLRGGRRGKRSRFAIGVMGIAAVLAFTYVAFTKRIPFVHHYQVNAVFATSSQLRTGAPVRIAGVDVGRVSRIWRGPHDDALVTMEINDNGRPVHRDATMKIRARIFLEGGFYVDLRPGTPNSPEIADRGMVPVSQTAGTVQFNQVLTALDRPTRESIQRTVAQLAIALRGGGAEGLRSVNLQLAPALVDTAQVTEAARGIAPHDLSNLVRSASLITSTLADRDRHLADLVTNLRRTTSALASRQGELGATLRQLDGALREAPPALDAVDRALPSLQRFSDAALPGVRAAPPVLDQTASTLVQARALVQPAELPALLDDLRPTTQTLPGLVDELRDLFPLVTPVVDCVRDQALPVLKSKLDDGRLSTDYPTYLELVHAAVGLAGATQSFDANGPSVHYSFGTGSQVLGPFLGGGERLFGLGNGISGARPTWLGEDRLPPFRPDKSCRDQKPPDLSARTSSSAASVATKRARPQVARRQLGTVLEQLLGGGKAAAQGQEATGRQHGAAKQHRSKHRGAKWVDVLGGRE